MTNPQPHKQVPAKVTAFVDEGIKDLVELLNTFENISTWESCEGRKGKRLAFVSMDYGDWNGDYRKAYNDGREFDEMTHFVIKLVQLVAKYTRGSISGGYEMDISIKWQGDKRFPVIFIEMPPSCIKKITDIISLVRAEFETYKGNIQPLHNRGEGHEEHSL